MSSALFSTRVNANVLNLPQYRVLQVDEREDGYRLHTEIAAEHTSCPRCRSGKVRRWGTREILFRDLPMHGKRVSMYVRARRLRCNDCGKAFQERLPALSEKRLITERLADWVVTQSLKRSFTSIAGEVGVDAGTIRNIVRDYVAELEARREVETPIWLGIDQLYVVKPRCVVANVEHKTIVNILVDRNEKTVAGCLRALPQRSRIRYVVMDMWETYRDAVRAMLPQATVVVDKCHVVRMVNVAMEQARKSLTLGEADRLKKGFFAIYDAPSKPAAEMHYRAWEGSIPQAERGAFAPILAAWNDWHPEILAYFDHPIANAYAGSLNGLTRALNRLGRSYSFEALRAKILFTEGPQKQQAGRGKFERRNRRNLGVDIPALAAMIEDGLFSA